MRDRPVIPSQRRQPGELEQRRRDVGEDAVARAGGRAAARPTSTNGTGLSEWAVTGLAVGVAQLVGVAVVRGDRQQGAGRRRVAGVDGLDRRDDPGRGSASMTSRAAIVASQTPVWPTMSGLA